MAIFSTTGSDTYPVGHVVQNTVPVRAATITTGKGAWRDTVVTAAVTPLFDDSAIVIHATFSVTVTGESSSDHGYAIRVKKSGTGVTNTYGSPLIGPSIQDEGYSYHYRDSVQYAQLNNTHHLTQIDNDCETTNAITYMLQNMTYGVDGDLQMGGNGWDNIQWMMWFQEIKR
jgi:hypothetical protein